MRNAVSNERVDRPLIGQLRCEELRRRPNAECGRELAISPSAIARAIAFSIEQSAEVDVNEMIVRPTAQG